MSDNPYADAAKRPPLPRRHPEDEIAFRVSGGPVGWDAYEHQPPAPREGADPRARPARPVGPVRVGLTNPPMSVVRVGLTNPPMSVSKCACGGEVVAARPRSEDDLTAAMNTHQKTHRHMAWRKRTEAER